MTKKTVVKTYELPAEMVSVYKLFNRCQPMTPPTPEEYAQSEVENLRFAVAAEKAKITIGRWPEQKPAPVAVPKVRKTFEPQLHRSTIVTPTKLAFSLSYDHFTAEPEAKTSEFVKYLMGLGIADNTAKTQAGIAHAMVRKELTQKVAV